jgi:GNAT superfamily N-acetyltransferase
MPRHLLKTIPFLPLPGFRNVDCAMQRTGNCLVQGTKMTFCIDMMGDDPASLIRLTELLQEMQAHYAVPCPSPEEILQGLRDRPGSTEIVIATEGPVLMGFAAFSALYPGPYLQPGMFLKELYVANAHRGRGVGRELLVYMSRLARDRGLFRIDWTADANEERLLRFYDRLGGQQKPDKIFYRLDGDALTELASSCENR